MSAFQLSVHPASQLGGSNLVMQVQIKWIYSRNSVQCILNHHTVHTILKFVNYNSKNDGRGVGGRGWEGINLVQSYQIVKNKWCSDLGEN